MDDQSQSVDGSARSGSTRRRDRPPELDRLLEVLFGQVEERPPPHASSHLLHEPAEVGEEQCLRERGPPQLVGVDALAGCVDP